MVRHVANSMRRSLLGAALLLLLYVAHIDERPFTERAGGFLGGIIAATAAGPSAVIHLPPGYDAVYDGMAGGFCATLRPGVPAAAVPARIDPPLFFQSLSGLRVFAVLIGGVFSNASVTIRNTVLDGGFLAFTNAVDVDGYNITLNNVTLTNSTAGITFGSSGTAANVGLTLRNVLVGTKIKTSFATLQSFRDSMSTSKQLYTNAPGCGSSLSWLRESQGFAGQFYKPWAAHSGDDSGLDAVPTAKLTAVADVVAATHSVQRTIETSAGSGLHFRWSFKRSTITIEESLISGSVVFGGSVETDTVITIGPFVDVRAGNSGNCSNPQVAANHTNTSDPASSYLRTEMCDHKAAVAFVQSAAGAGGLDATSSLVLQDHTRLFVDCTDVYGLTATNEAAIEGAAAIGFAKGAVLAGRVDIQGSTESSVLLAAGSTPRLPGHDKGQLSAVAAVSIDTIAGNGSVVVVPSDPVFYSTSSGVFNLWSCPAAAATSDEVFHSEGVWTGPRMYATARNETFPTQRLSTGGVAAAVYVGMVNSSYVTIALHRTFVRAVGNQFTTSVVALSNVADNVTDHVAMSSVLDGIETTVSPAPFADITAKATFPFPSEVLVLRSPVRDSAKAMWPTLTADERLQCPIPMTPNTLLPLVRFTLTISEGRMVVFHLGHPDGVAGIASAIAVLSKGAAVGARDGTVLPIRLHSLGAPAFASMVEYGMADAETTVDKHLPPSAPVFDNRATMTWSEAFIELQGTALRRPSKLIGTPPVAFHSPKFSEVSAKRHFSLAAAGDFDLESMSVARTHDTSIPCAVVYLESTTAVGMNVALAGLTVRAEGLSITTAVWIAPYAGEDEPEVFELGFLNRDAEITAPAAPPGPCDHDGEISLRCVGRTQIPAAAPFGRLQLSNISALWVNPSAGGALLRTTSFVKTVVAIEIAAVRFAAVTSATYLLDGVRLPSGVRGASHVIVDGYASVIVSKAPYGTMLDLSSTFMALVVFVRLDLKRALPEGNPSMMQLYAEDVGAVVVEHAQFLAYGEVCRGITFFDVNGIDKALQNVSIHVQRINGTLLGSQAYGISFAEMKGIRSIHVSRAVLDLNATLGESVHFQEPVFEAGPVMFEDIHTTATFRAFAHRSFNLVSVVAGRKFSIVQVHSFIVRDSSLKVTAASSSIVPARVSGALRTDAAVLSVGAIEVSNFSLSVTALKSEYVACALFEENVTSVTNVTVSGCRFASLGVEFGGGLAVLLLGKPRTTGGGFLRNVSAVQLSNNIVDVFPRDPFEIVRSEASPRWWAAGRGASFHSSGNVVRSLRTEETPMDLVLYPRLSVAAAIATMQDMRAFVAAISTFSVDAEYVAAYRGITEEDAVNASSDAAGDIRITGNVLNVLSFLQQADTDILALRLNDTDPPPEFTDGTRSSFAFDGNAIVSSMEGAADWVPLTVPHREDVVRWFEASPIGPTIAGVGSTSTAISLIRFDFPKGEAVWNITAFDSVSFSRNAYHTVRNTKSTSPPGPSLSLAVLDADVVALDLPLRFIDVIRVAIDGNNISCTHYHAFLAGGPAVVTLPPRTVAGIALRSSITGVHHFSMDGNTITVKSSSGDPKPVTSGRVADAVVDALMVQVIVAAVVVMDKVTAALVPVSSTSLPADVEVTRADLYGVVYDAGRGAVLSVSGNDLSVAASVHNAALLFMDDLELFTATVALNSVTSKTLPWLDAAGVPVVKTVGGAPMTAHLTTATMVGVWFKTAVRRSTTNITSNIVVASGFAVRGVGIWLQQAIYDAGYAKMSLACLTTAMTPTFERSSVFVTRNVVTVEAQNISTGVYSNMLRCMRHVAIDDNRLRANATGLLPSVGASVSAGDVVQQALGVSVVQISSVTTLAFGSTSAELDLGTVSVSRNVVLVAGGIASVSVASTPDAAALVADEAKALPSIPGSHSGSVDRYNDPSTGAAISIRSLNSVALATVNDNTADVRGETFNRAVFLYTRSVMTVRRLRIERNFAAVRAARTVESNVFTAFVVFYGVYTSVPSGWAIRASTAAVSVAPKGLVGPPPAVVEALVPSPEKCGANTACLIDSLPPVPAVAVLKAAFGTHFMQSSTGDVSLGGGVGLAAAVVITPIPPLALPIPVSPPSGVMVAIEECDFSVAGGTEGGVGMYWHSHTEAQSSFDKKQIKAFDDAVRRLSNISAAIEQNISRVLLTSMPANALHMRRNVVRVTSVLYSDALASSTATPPVPRPSVDLPATMAASAVKLDHPEGYDSFHLHITDNVLSAVSYAGGAVVSVQGNVRLRAASPLFWASMGFHPAFGDLVSSGGFVPFVVASLARRYTGPTWHFMRRITDDGADGLLLFDPSAVALYFGASTGLPPGITHLQWWSGEKVFNITHNTIDGLVSTAATYEASNPAVSRLITLTTPTVSTIAGVNISGAVTCQNCTSPTLAFTDVLGDGSGAYRAGSAALLANVLNREAVLTHFPTALAATQKARRVNSASMKHVAGTVSPVGRVDEVERSVRGFLAGAGASLAELSESNVLVGTFSGADVDAVLHLQRVLSSQLLSTIDVSSNTVNVIAADTTVVAGGISLGTLHPSSSANATADIAALGFEPTLPPAELADLPAGTVTGISSVTMDHNDVAVDGGAATTSCVSVANAFPSVLLRSFGGRCNATATGPTGAAAIALRRISHTTFVSIEGINVAASASHGLDLGQDCGNVTLLALINNKIVSGGRAVAIAGASAEVSSFIVSGGVHSSAGQDGALHVGRGFLATLPRNTDVVDGNASAVVRGGGYAVVQDESEFSSTHSSPVTVDSSGDPGPFPPTTLYLRTVSLHTNTSRPYVSFESTKADAATIALQTSRLSLLESAVVGGAAAAQGRISVQCLQYGNRLAVATDLSTAPPGVATAFVPCEDYCVEPLDLSGCTRTPTLSQSRPTPSHSRPALPSESLSAPPSVSASVLPTQTKTKTSTRSATPTRSLPSTPTATRSGSATVPVESVVLWWRNATSTFATAGLPGAPVNTSADVAAVRYSPAGLRSGDEATRTLVVNIGPSVTGDGQSKFLQDSFAPATRMGQVVAPPPRGATLNVLDPERWLRQVTGDAALWGLGSAGMDPDNWSACFATIAAVPARLVTGGPLATWGLTAAESAEFESVGAWLRGASVLQQWSVSAQGIDAAVSAAPVTATTVRRVNATHAAIVLPRWGANETFPSFSWRLGVKLSQRCFARRSTPSWAPNENSAARPSNDRLYAGAGFVTVEPFTPTPTTNPPVDTAGTTAGSVAAGASAVLGSGAGAGLVARTMAIARIQQCEDGLAGDKLPWSDSPTTLTIGHGATQYHSGAVVGNMGLVGGFCLFQVAVGAAILFVKVKASPRSKTAKAVFKHGFTWVAVTTVARFPSLTVFPVLFLVQPLLTSAVVVLFWGTGNGGFGSSGDATPPPAPDAATPGQGQSASRAAPDAALLKAPPSTTETTYILEPNGDIVALENAPPVELRLAAVAALLCIALQAAWLWRMLFRQFHAVTVAVDTSGESAPKAVHETVKDTSALEAPFMENPSIVSSVQEAVRQQPSVLRRFLRVLHDPEEWVEDPVHTKSRRRAGLPPSNFLRRHFLYFADFGKRSWWFFFAELCLSLGIGVIAGLAQIDTRACEATAWLTSAAFLAYTCAIVYLRPYSAVFENGFNGFVGAVQFAAALLSTVGLYTGESDALETAVDALVYIVLYLSLFRVGHDFLRAAAHITHKNVVERTKGARRSMWQRLVASATSFDESDAESDDDDGYGWDRELKDVSHDGASAAGAARTLDADAASTESDHGLLPSLPSTHVVPLEHKPSFAGSSGGTSSQPRFTQRFHTGIPENVRRAFEVLADRRSELARQQALLNHCPPQGL